MTAHQRQSLINLMGAILACNCCPPDIRLRAESLLSKLQGDFLASIFGEALRGRRP